MARVTALEVKDILDTDLSDSVVEAFISDASNLIDELFEDETGLFEDETGVSDELLASIEKWVAAHFVAIRDQRPKSEKVGDASITYHGTSGKGLEFTPYGQQALLLDTTGRLKSIGGKRATFKAVDMNL